MKKIIFALIGLSLLFTSCSNVDTSKSLLYAEKVNDSIVVLHKGTTKDTVKIGTSRFQSANEKKLLKIESGSGIVLVPEYDGEYKLVDVKEMNYLEESIGFGILIGIFGVFLLIVLIVFIFGD